MSVDRKGIKRLQEEVRSVLMEHWDPLEVRGIPQAADEYDDCIGGVMHLLLEGGSDEDLLDYLRKQFPGLSQPQAELRNTVAALRHLRLPSSV